MKHKLTPIQEEIFWNYIAEDIVKETPFGKPSNWEDRVFKEFDSAMKMHLWKLRDDPNVDFLCEIVNENNADNFAKSKLANSSMIGIIREIFVSKISRKRQARIKNRFTYFLKDMSFDEYVEFYGIHEMEESNIEDKQSSEYTPSQLSDFIEGFEYRAEQIRDRAREYYEKVEEIETYLKKFNALHVKHIDILRGGNLNLAYTVVKDIHVLSANLQSQVDENSTAHTFFSGLSGFYLRDESTGAIISLYLTSGDKLGSYFANFLEDESPSEVEIQKFYQAVHQLYKDK